MGAPTQDEYAISITTLFERERLEHLKDHEQEYLVAQATAQRLEREVEQTAQRLERMVEETALRLEKGVSTALEAVAKTAQVHSEAHNREHVAHERIHSVEKTQVDKAEVAQQEAARVALEALNRRLDAMNEFRASLEDFQARSVSREMFDQRTQTVDTRLSSLEKLIVGRDVFNSSLESRDQAIDSVNKDVAALRETVIRQFALQGGQKEGALDVRALVFSLIAAAVAIIGVVWAIAH